MKPVAQHVSLAALESASYWANSDTRFWAILADDSEGRANVAALELALRTRAPRSAYRAYDALGFLWSSVRLPK